MHCSNVFFMSSTPATSGTCFRGQLVKGTEVVMENLASKCSQHAPGTETRGFGLGDLPEEELPICAICRWIYFFK